MKATDIILVALAASILLVAYLIDPHKTYYHNMCDRMSERSAALAVLAVQGANALLVSAIIYTCKGELASLAGRLRTAAAAKLKSPTG